MDAFAVAIASGIMLKHVNFRQTFRLSWHFGFFQAMMPVLGWLAGLTIHNFIAQVDHWIAFGFLCFIGINMIREAFGSEEKEKTHKDPTKGTKMVMLSIATSIDAFAVGLTLCLLQVSIWIPSLIIGITALIFTAIGLHLGRWVRSASRIGNYAEFLGGLILIGIGVKIICDHGVFS